MSMTVAVSGHKVQEALDIRDQILAKDRDFIGMVGILLTDPEFQQLSAEQREQMLRKQYAKTEAERQTLIDFGRRLGVV